MPPGLGYANGPGVTSLYAQYESVKSEPAEISVSERELLDLSIFPSDFTLASGGKKTFCGLWALF
ncbi:hypothetical protein JCM19239_2665 [Vibrio variabilis]|uniref:Uncharacterized protein n=1 Tax=Vibrio variabilis TaxID=990271 RepID=A0ABQ0JNJ4_9VIBR|nr:hypothetical protein JCM19239_2665 [Vibrio variabilis]